MLSESLKIFDLNYKYKSMNISYTKYLFFILNKNIKLYHNNSNHLNMKIKFTINTIENKYCNIIHSYPYIINKWSYHKFNIRIHICLRYIFHPFDSNSHHITNIKNN
jgi:hypothetical protein